VLAGLAEYGPILIAIDTESAESGFWRNALAGIGATATAVTDNRRTFLMLPAREGVAAPPGTPLRLIAGSASPGRFVLQDLTDGNPSTHWRSTELQRGDERIDVQLDGVHRVTGVVLSMGPHGEGYPRRLRIETSQDGATWNAAAEETPAGMAFSTVIRNFSRAQLSFRIPDVESRFVRLNQLGRDPHAFWFITDITVLGQ